MGGRRYKGHQLRSVASVSGAAFTLGLLEISVGLTAMLA